MNEFGSFDPAGEWRHLWPHPDNQTLIQETLGTLLDDYYRWHARWQPPGAAPSPANDPALQRSLSLLRELSRRLQADSVPWPALQYLAHMNSDTLLPAGLAYFVAMLYNPNNVTPEASPVTTPLERELSDDFCGLFGFDRARGWAHLTSGGHAANYEAMWIARNLKRVPFALAGTPAQAASCENGNLSRLCNMPPADIARLLKRATSRGQREVVLSRIREARSHPALADGRILVAQGRHYAWDKCADLLGLTLEPVELDSSMRIDVARLRERLFTHLREARPIVAVVATAGSSGEGSVDEIHRIAALRRECMQRFGASFFLHVDAAFGGYFRTLLQAPDEIDTPLPAFATRDPSEALKPEVADSLRALSQADTITIDPHKCAGVPYPAGCLAIRDRRYSWVIASRNRYFEQTPSRLVDFGGHTLEGARPGAAAAAVWTAHRLLGLHQNGYGAFLAGNLLTASRLHQALNAVPPFRLDKTIHRFRSVLEPDLCILNFCAHPAAQVILSAGRIERLSEQMIGNAQLHRSGDEKLPWFSRNRMPLRNAFPGDACAADETTVVRCCVMKPVANEQFPAFLRSSLDRLFARIEGKET
jgi:glutamate/tyrosine decarboxylase-like PLP-dependent enzyme